MENRSSTLPLVISIIALVVGGVAMFMVINAGTLQTAVLKKTPGLSIDPVSGGAVFKATKEDITIDSGGDITVTDSSGRARRGGFLVFPDGYVCVYGIENGQSVYYCFYPNL